LLQSLSSDNPLRTNINYTSEQLFFLEYVLKYGLNAGLTRIYNETIEGMAKFYTDAIGAGKIPSKSSTGEVKVEVKYLAEGKPVYTDISTHWPHEFIKNKSVSQTIVFRHHITSNDVVDIITVPFMYGCRWCITANKSPFELHKGGENALNYRDSLLLKGHLVSLWLMRRLLTMLLLQFIVRLISVMILLSRRRMRRIIQLNINFIKESNRENLLRKRKRTHTFLVLDASTNLSK